MKQPPLLGQLTKMNFWKTEKGDDQDQDAKVQVNIISPDEKNKSPQHYDASTASTDDSQNGNAIVEDSVKTLSKPQHALIPPNIPYPSSPSKRAVHIMNQTSGLCADPIHFHSFTTVDNGWIPTPKSLFVGAFQKCIICHGRLGGSVTMTAVIHPNNDTDGSEMMLSTSSSSGMLHCVACGVYAHRSCAFARSNPSLMNDVNNIPPLCEVNLIEIQKAYGMHRQQKEQLVDATATPETTEASSSWSIFGKRSSTETKNEDGIIGIEEEKEPVLDESSNQAQQSGVIETSQGTTEASSSWSIFGQRLSTETKTGDDSTALVEKKESVLGESSNQAQPPGVIETSQETTEASSSWSIFGKRSSTETNNEDDSTALVEKKEPIIDELKPKSVQPQQPGVFQTSIKLIQKTTETSKNIPQYSTIGLVAGGAAGLVIAGPAGVIVGSQIGRNALAIGAAIEGGIGMSVLAMSLAAAANFSLPSLPTISSGKKNRELKLSNTLILVRPDIAVDPIWGEYAEEARKSWAEKNTETMAHQHQSSYGSFGLGHLFNPNKASDEQAMRYRKDSDIIKADASELPLREKVFLLVNRILNDKMSLPGYVYRYLILKHKRRTMFGDEWSTDDAEKYSLRASWFGSSKSKEDENDDDDVQEAALRSCRQDAHGVIKHVTATLLEVRPGLASSPNMTELSASAVEVLVFGELYNDVIGEIIQQTEEKDESLMAKVDELKSKCNIAGKTATNDEEVASSPVSQSAIGALKSLPQAHTPTDKLLHCVEFLEYVSEHFSSLFKGKCIDADTLLVMVCQHVVAASVNHLHAEVAFIEEFSRDEQLLSGKEGYALITLQASLYYLDGLEELPNDLSPFTQNGDVGKQGSG